jgi:hypothetical protein
MTQQDDQAPGPEPVRHDESDQLSPSHARRESLGASESQRIGDNGPIANPIVSFPEDSDEETPGVKDGD